MKIPSGSTDRVLYFVAVDATDLKTRETGLSSWTVYRVRDGGVSTLWTTPSVFEVDATNMAGVYQLTLDEDTTLDAGHDTEEMIVHIIDTGGEMAPVTRSFEIYRPETTEGNTLDVTSTGAAGIDWGNIENPTTAVDLSGTDIQLCDTVTTLTNLPAITTDWLTAAGLATDAVNEIVDQVWDELQSAHVTAGSFGEIATEIASILVDTAEIGAAGAGLTAIPDMATATALTTVDTVVDAIKVKTDFLPSATAGAAGGVFIAGTNAATTVTTSFTTTFTGNLTGSVGSVTGAVGSVTGNVDGNVTGSVGSLVGHTVQTADHTANIAAILVDTAEIGAAGAGLTDLGGMSTTMKAEINTEVDSAFTTQMADSAATDGSIATREQALYMIHQFLTERAVSGTTLTVKKVDGSTTLFTCTLDDGTSPTSITRS